MRSRIVRTLSYLTDSIIHRCNGKVEDKGDYYLIRTRSNPTFYWGNYLLFKKAPDRECYPEWMRLSVMEFGTETGHVTFGWDSAEPGDTTAFADEGFQTDTSVVLILSQLDGRGIENDQIQIRRLSRDS